MALILLAVLLPLVGGAILPLLRLEDRRRRSIYVQAVTTATSLVVLALLLLGDSETHTLFRMTDSLALAFRLDGAGRVFMGLIAFLWPLATLYAFEYMAHEEHEIPFFAFYTITYGVTLCITMAANLFSLYVFYECLTLITLPLVTHKMDAKSALAGRRYLVYSIGGAALAFIGLVFIMTFGVSNTAFQFGGVLTAEAVAGREQLLRLVFLLGFIGFGTKAAVFPMHAWLPLASVAPTPVTALLHAVAVVNTGAFACIRLIYYSFGTDLLYGTWAQGVAICLSAFTIVYGSAMAVREQHFKRRLAYSTVSNLSYILFGAALMTPAGLVGSLSHLVFHGLMKITLFYCAGAVLVRTGKEYVQDLRGYFKIMPFTMGVYTLAAIALVGTPPLCGFISKWNLITASTASGLPIAALGSVALILSTILTAVYLLYVVVTAAFSPPGEGVALQNRDPGLCMKAPLLLLCAAIVLCGLYSTPLVHYFQSIAAGLC